MNMTSFYSTPKPKISVKIFVTTPFPYHWSTQVTIIWG